MLISATWSEALLCRSPFSVVRAAGYFAMSLSSLNARTLTLLYAGLAGRGRVDSGSKLGTRTPSPFAAQLESGANLS